MNPWAVAWVMCPCPQACMQHQPPSAQKPQACLPTGPESLLQMVGSVLGFTTKAGVGRKLLPA